jgi:hypothetical protein
MTKHSTVLALKSDKKPQIYISKRHSYHSQDIEAKTLPHYDHVRLLKDKVCFKILFEEVKGLGKL